MNSVRSIDLTGAQFKNTLPKRQFKHRVLLVEDSQESENLMRHICETVDGNMRLKCVKTAEEAQQLLQSNSNFDLIIADHFLAGQKTGLDLWRNCQERFRQIPFMMTSSLTNEEFIQKTDHEWNYPLFLHKPFNRKDCQQMIEWYLGETPKVRRKAKPLQNQSEAKAVSKSILEKIFRLLGAATFIAFLIFSTQVKMSKKVLPENLRQNEFKTIQPANIINEKLEIPKVTPKKVIEFKDVFTPDLMHRIARIEKRADEINEIVNFNSDTWHRETLKHSDKNSENLNSTAGIKNDEGTVNIDTD